MGPPGSANLGASCFPRPLSIDHNVFWTIFRHHFHSALQHGHVSTVPGFSFPMHPHQISRKRKSREQLKRFRETDPLHPSLVHAMTKQDRRNARRLSKVAVVLEPALSEPLVDFADMEARIARIQDASQRSMFFYPYILFDHLRHSDLQPVLRHTATEMDLFGHHLLIFLGRLRTAAHLVVVDISAGSISHYDAGRHCSPEFDPFPVVKAYLAEEARSRGIIDVDIDGFATNPMRDASSAYGAAYILAVLQDIASH